MHTKRQLHQSTIYMLTISYVPVRCYFIDCQLNRYRLHSMCSFTIILWIELKEFLFRNVLWIRSSDKRHCLVWMWRMCWRLHIHIIQQTFKNNVNECRNFKNEPHDFECMSKFFNLPLFWYLFRLLLWTFLS